MKHKIKSVSFPEFDGFWRAFLDRLADAGEKIVKAKFVFDGMNSFVGYRATVWTERKEKKGGAE